MILDNNTGFKDIGYTLIHEHLTIDLSRLKEDDDAKLDDVDSLIEDLKELKKSGIDTIVLSTR